MGGQSRGRLKVGLGARSYSVHVVSHDSSALATFLGEQCTERRCLLITNSVVGPLHLPPLVKELKRQGLEAPYLILPDGERTKNRATVELTYDWLFEQNAHRRSVLVLLGGGVLGDVGGFVAATFLRGLRYVQVPTTLVAQVDSSMGGKVGIDHREGKNLIGAFYQPIYVHCDVAYLETLPEREFLCGLAEVIKYAVIADPVLFQMLNKKRIQILRRDPALLERIVQTCCRIKVRVVQADEQELTGKRMILNFGHTIGHALERLTEYRDYQHGEAVALGMVAAARLSEQRGLCSHDTAEQIYDLITSYGLPSTCPHFLLKDWEKSLKRDKKVRGHEIHYVFVKSIGQVEVLPCAVGELAHCLVQGGVP